MRLNFSLVLILALGGPLGLVACEKGDSGTGGGATTGEPRQRPQQPIEQPAAECPADCRTLIAGLNEYPRLAVWSAGYGQTDFVQLKNLSRAPVTFDGWVASTGAAQSALPPGITLAEGAFVMFHLGQTGNNSAQNIYLPELSLGPVGEFALFSSANLENSDDIRVYVRWGADPASGEASHLATAQAGELWHRSGFVPLCEGYTRFGAVGDNMLPRGFRSMPDECFPTAEPVGAPGGFPGR